MRPACHNSDNRERRLMAGARNIVGLAALAPPRKMGEAARRGLTILEMLVSTTLLALIVLGLTAMFVQTQKAFRVGIKQSDVTDAGRTITQMIANDLSQLADAQNPGITNLFIGWVPNNSLIQKVQSGATTSYLTNQLQEIYMLTHSNTTWTGVGYVVIDQAPGVGSLYRYSASTNTVPGLFTNNLFWPFFNAIVNQNIGKSLTNVNYSLVANFSLIADGVVHLKIRTYDQYGNEPSQESEADANDTVGLITYPLGLSPLAFGTPTNNLPSSIELEVGVLEPEAYERAKSMSGSPLVQSNYLVTAAGQTHIFREHILIPGYLR